MSLKRLLSLNLFLCLDTFRDTYPFSLIPQLITHVVDQDFLEKCHVRISFSQKDELF